MKQRVSRLSERRPLADLLEDARRAIEQGRCDDAIGLYRVGLERDPASGVLRNNLGCLLLERGDVAEAIEVLDDPIVHHGIAEHRRNLAYALLRGGEPARAESMLRAHLESSPEDSDARNHLGLALLGCDEEAAALEEFTRVVRENPSHLEGWNNLGCAFERRGDLEAARDAFRVALRKDPYSVDAHNNVGCVLRELGRLDEAIEELTVAVELEPNNPMVHLNLALSYRRNGEHRKALSHLRRHVQAGTDTEPEIHELLQELETQEKEPTE